MHNSVQSLVIQSKQSTKIDILKVGPVSEQGAETRFNQETAIFCYGRCPGVTAVRVRSVLPGRARRQVSSESQAWWLYGMGVWFCRGMGVTEYHCAESAVCWFCYIGTAVGARGHRWT